jgi:NADPH-dependent glutamate synthase beta subunit-like oxidoreductase
VTRWGTIKADFRTHATSLPGVYAAGDIVRGASLGGLGDPGRARGGGGDPDLRAYGKRMETVWIPYGFSGGNVRHGTAAGLTR